MVLERGKKLVVFIPIIIVLLIIFLNGCKTISDASAISAKKLDTTAYPHAVISGEPSPLSGLSVEQPPMAIACQPVWDDSIEHSQMPAKEFIQGSQDITLKMTQSQNDHHEILTEYCYEKESTGEKWREYYIDKRLIYQGCPQKENISFYAQWIGEKYILFRSEEYSGGFFFLLDTRFKEIMLFHDLQWKRMPEGREPITDDMWQYYNPELEVKLGGYEEKTGQIFFFVSGERTTLFEYNPLRPNSVTVLLDNLPPQTSVFTNHAGKCKLSQREDGTVWFSVESDIEPGQSDMVFTYHAKSKHLTPVLTYTSDLACYFHRNFITIHGKDNLSVFDCKTGTVYPLEDCSGMYVVTEIGPTRQECIMTYSKREKRHYLWDIAESKRYYVTYDDMVPVFPDADKMEEDDQLVYYHGEGKFYLENAREDKFSYDGYKIDWYASIRQTIR